MTLRSTLLAGAQALAGLFGSAGKADAQVVMGYGSPYGYSWGYPYATTYSTPIYGYWGNPYWSSPTRGLAYASPYWTGYSSPYWVGQAYSAYNPFVGSTYYRGVYASPGLGYPGVYSYRYWRW